MKKDVLHTKKEFTNVRALIEWAGEEYGERYAWSFRREGMRGDIIKVTYKEFRDDVRALSSKLIEMGCAGKHCVLVGKCTYEWILTYYAVLSVGGVLIPLDRDWTAVDLADTAEKADADFLFYDEDISDKAEVIGNAVELSCEPVVLYSKEGNSSLSDLVKDGRDIYNNNSVAYHSIAVDPMRLSLLVFTSGTTGKGKGVMLSQNAILSDMSDVIPYIDFRSKTVSVLPPHHTYGSTVMFIGHVMIGCEVYISSGIRYVQKELKEQKPGHMVLVPLYLETFYRKIMANIRDQGKEKLVMNMIKVSSAMRKVGIDQRRRIFSSILDAFGGEVEMIITGGAPINPEILTFFQDIGISVLNGYGITECAPLIAVNRSRNVVPGSVGNVIDMDTVRIDEPNEDGEGEILVKGPNVMLGYYKDHEATANAFKEGYFRTGDYGKLDKKGILYITGRKKNLIILANGKNVYPEEIENELIAAPGIQDIIVYEGQSKRGISYNAIVAEVYPDKEFFEKNGITDVKSHIKSYIDEYNKTAVPYKKIAMLKVRDADFPKNTLRKIMRFKLDTTIE
ncbi:MAG: AMP-binding protein [Clostridia bacterium]|nr:AMP-binding protein [Clostridia bacterium]